ncbi:MAG TPA: RNA methyltransferase [Gammaproteobacteria bacterium]
MEIPVRIVLVATSHPGNIGASARAMKTMGLEELVLVAPKHFPHEEATAMASGADDVLAAARVVESLPEAVADCGYVAGASARLRSVPAATLNPRECAAAVWRATDAGVKAALVFGPEQSGLTNEDLARCRELVHIPTAPGYGSLNLAMAVQVLCYELRMWRLLEEGRGHVPAPPASDFPPATAAELEGFHEHLERVLVAAGFLHREHQKQIKLKLRRIFHRAGLDRNEVNILRGMLTALDPEKRVGPRSDVT